MNLVLLSVYRARNRRSVRSTVEQTVAAGGSARLWALDEPVAELKEFTLGTGTGGRFDLLNNLLSDGVDPRAAVLISDDDAVFDRGNPAVLLDRAESAGLHLCQPAHSRRSHSTYRFCRRRPYLRARRTNFVEIGPVVLVTSRGRGEFTPFPAGSGMGWGVDLLWRDRALDGTPIGIVDDVTIRHQTPLGQSYDMSQEGAKLGRMLGERGLGRVEDDQRVLARWPRWPPRPAPGWSP